MRKQGLSFAREMEMEIFYDVENILKSANPKNPNSDNGRHRTVKVGNGFPTG